MSLYLQRGVGLLCFLYSLNCRVEFFSETRPPTTVILGNPVSDKRASRKPSFVLCSDGHTARSVGYTGLPSQEGGVAQSRSYRKLERREEKVTLLRKPEVTASLVDRSGGTRKLWAWQTKWSCSKNSCGGWRP